MDTNECYVYFAFDGDEFNPDDLTETLGIEPTSVKRKGERIPNKIPRYNSWALSTDKVINEFIDVDEIAISIIDILRPKVNLINQIKKKFNVDTRLEVVLWITADDSQSTPAVGFSAETIKFLATVGAYIDIDTYRN